MSTSKIDRRQFLSAGACVCGACVCSGLAGFVDAGEEKIDPAKLNFCGYTCPPDCKFLKATLEDDVELKKEAWKLWKLEERFGVAFDAEQAICYGCKAMDKPQGIVIKRCDVGVEPA